MDTDLSRRSAAVDNIGSSLIALTSITGSPYPEFKHTPVSISNVHKECTDDARAPVLFLPSMQNLTHPELEIRLLESVLPDGLSEKGDTAHERLTVDVVEVYPDQAGVARNLRHSELLARFQAEDFIENFGAEGCKKPPALRVIFVEDPAYSDSSVHPVNQRPKLNKTAAWLQQRFGMTLSFFENMSPSLHMRVTACGTFTQYNDEGDSIALAGFYQNSHGLTADPAHIWFSHSLQEPYSSVYVIYNPSEGAKKHIMRCAESQNPTLLLRPLSIDAFMEEDYLNGWFVRMGDLRTRLVHYEDDKIIASYSPAQCAKAVEDLHDIHKHLQVAHGNFLDLKEKVPFILGIRDKYLSMCSPPRQMSARDMNTITESFELMLMRGQHMIRWSVNYHERTGIRINLFFNLTQQADSRTNLDIARLTTKISVTAQRDSSSMITMAAVTMFFLPGSFVSALFSMVFFNSATNENGETILAVAPQWWMFPTVAIPLTIIVFLIWIVWRRRRHVAAVSEVERTLSFSSQEKV